MGSALNKFKQSRARYYHWTNPQAGFPLSFGVFQDYYSQLPQFAGDPYVAVVGTVASGWAYLGAPFIVPIVRRYSRYRRQKIMLGCTYHLLMLVQTSV